MYAAGKIPGSFFKREGRAGEKGTLTARMIDRPIRPLFPKGWTRETQLVAIPMSIDHVNPYDILAMNGASAALDDVRHPRSRCRSAQCAIGQDEEGDFVVNPDEERLLESPLDLVVAGTEEAILMVEAGASEVSEAEILDALDIAHGEIKKLCQAQHELREKAGKEKVEVDVPQVDEASARRAEGQVRRRRSTTATQVEDKLERQDATKRSRRRPSQAALRRARTPTTAPAPRRPARVRQAGEGHDPPAHRRRQEAARRPLGRRDPRRSGSRWASPRARTARRSSPAARRRPSRSRRSAPRARRCGSTRSASRPTKRYFHHYNFPPFSVGEAGFMRGPKRRDIGHGALAERALVPGRARRRRTSRTRSAWCRTSSSPTARRRWRRSAARASR